LQIFIVVLAINNYEIRSEPMKVAVTGASGHIGNCLVRELVKKKAEVKVLLHNFENDLRKLPVEIIKGNMLDPGSMNRLCEDADVVYHLAAKIAIDKKEKGLVYRTNVEGTQNLVNICLEKKIKKFIHFSSIHALAVHPLDQVLDENRRLVDNTATIYERSKADSELIVLKAVESGLNAVILNPTAVIGPYDFKQSYLGQALIKIYRNKLPMLIPGGYDWVDVRDVVNAAIHAETKGRVGERYILSGHWHCLKELSEMTERISGKKTTKIQAPLFIARLGIPFIKIYSVLRNEHPLYTSESLDILKNSPRNISCEKAKRELDYNPRPLEETLKDTFLWYKQNSLIK
jgi:dihydroflavonol-4-reductase